VIESDDDLLVAMLDSIEQREARLLAWGLVDGFVSRRELRDIADGLLDGPDIGGAVTISDADTAIAGLAARALVLDVGDPPGERFRSRMAETVRLLFRLRQLFPKHAGPTLWQTAPTLVADFRFIWRRRRYPERAILPAKAVAEISGSTTDPATQQAVTVLLESYGPDYRLAGFQIDAARRILAGLDAGRWTATLVSAGTGSGKTLAFYIPALGRVAAHLRRDPIASRWVKVLAVYPRTELLKDQFAEVYAQARRLDTFGRRKILIGTFFGPTPDSAAAAETASGWHRRGPGLACGYLRCPQPGCGGDLIWSDADRSARTERLVCEVCRHVIGSDEVVLTRSRLETESPDILFTTTEMLNQRIGDSRYRHLFGVGERAPRGVDIMLLDEAHTYAGGAGAQAAILLRRWRRLLRRPVSFVGLSATLNDGGRFFANLTGLPEHAAVEITPRGDAMIAEGAEYLLALRGDPVSRAALLSTTIQTAMLLSRMLDPQNVPLSQGLLGEKLFLFTDDIDVTNRMYFAMLDAEGRRSSGAPDMVNHPQGGLAILRRPMGGQQRKLHGQDWAAAITVGHTLQAQDRKVVGRVMSMDPGVDAGRDIIVATASLEVGFNDPKVGGVIQHKAPRHPAQFLQRKGRAGRPRRMRPWTVAVLSDYGRDRLAYQGYDQLFDPVLPPQALPTTNRHVLRIQAVYATMDYLSRALGAAAPPGSVWTNLSRPADPAHNRQRERQRRLADLLREILTSEGEQRRYASYLAEALRIAPEEIDLLLWDYPRPLMTQVLPTALRRLASGWAAGGVLGPEVVVGNSPLPEFAPANLFGDLNLPEVSIALPQVGTQPAPPWAMPLAQAMREFAPGRVSRRYGLSHAFERHWLCPVLDSNRSQDVTISQHIDADHLGNWPVATPGGSSPVPVFRPRRFRVVQPPGQVGDTSNARLSWRSQIVVRHLGHQLAAPSGSAWRRLLSGVRFHTHQATTAVEARRLALGSEADLRMRDGTSVLKSFRFIESGSPAAIGFSLPVDGLCLVLQHPHDLWRTLGGPEDPRARALRIARFHHEAATGAGLSSIDSVFAREWLGQLVVAAITSEAMAQSVSLHDAAVNLRQGAAVLDLRQTLNILFQSPIVDDANGQGNLQDRLRQDLAALIADPLILAALFQLAELLWEPIDATWEPWLRSRFSATVAAAAMRAVLALCPDTDESDLVVDLDDGPRDADDVRPAGEEIWITEQAPGGNGHIEEAARQYAEDPARFYRLMTAALEENDFALNDYQLQRFLETVIVEDSGGDLAAAARTFRVASDAEAAHRAFAVLRARLADAGFATYHAFLVALGNRVLRAGSSVQSDGFLLDALRTWAAEEVRLGIELDGRVVAYRLARDDAFDVALGRSGLDTPTFNPDQWRFSTIYGLLWPRGAQVRQSGLNLYSPYASLPPAEPLLVRSFLAEDVDVIDLRDPDWRERCLARLAQSGAVTLGCPTLEAFHAADAFAFLATNPVQSDYLSVFARVQSVRRVQGDLRMEVDVAEALQ
jgi:hypothetical protein